MERIIQTIKEHSSFYIFGHIDPDGDCIGSQLGLAEFLKKIGKKAVLVNDKKIAVSVNDESGDTLGEVVDKAPYNGDPEFSINTDKAKQLGFEFSDIRDWIFDLLDYYINS